MQIQLGAALRRVVAVATLALAASCATAGSYSWTTAGPETGYVYQVLVNSQNSDRISAAVGFYGPMLFQSLDRAQSWFQQPTILFNGRLIPHPTDANIVYTVGFFGQASGVLKSVDGGATWMAASAGLPTTETAIVSAIAISPSDPETLYAIFGGGPGQVYRSDDGAASWVLVSSTFPTYNVGDAQVDPQDSEVVYATSSGVDVIKSIDGGATWQPTASSLAASRIVIDPSNPQRLFVGTSTAGVFTSPDGGMTWQPANTGLELAIVRDLALDPSHPQTLWAATSSTDATGGIFVTTNAHDWSRVDLGEPVVIGTAVAIDASDSNAIYAGAGVSSALHGTVFQSLDGGATWARAEKGLSGQTTFSVVAHPTEASTAYTFASGRFYRTDDSGADWALRDDTGYALICLSIDPATPDTLYAGYAFPDFTGDGVLKSVDGGMSWNPATDGLSVGTLHRVAVSPSASDHVLAASNDGLSQTVDGGDLWAPVLSDGDVHSAAYDPADDAILYAGEFYGSLLRSPDGGMTWSPPAGLPALSVNNWDVAAPINDPLRVYLGTSQGIYRSVDRGLDFAAANVGLPPAPGVQAYRLAADPSRAGTLYMLALLGGGAAPDSPTQAVQPNVYRTTNGADSWVALPGFLPALGSYELSVSASGKTLYAATISGTFQFERSFADVPDADPFWPRVDAAALNGVTVGCGQRKFCPDDATLRSSFAVFLLRAKNGIGYAPPPATGTVFGDVAADSAAAAYIEELFREGITAGCGGGNYCPDALLSRAEAAVLLLKLEHGADYAPPPATGLVFTDVPVDAFAADWIEQLAAEGITAGCGSGAFCPGAPVSRAQAASFVVLTFHLS